MRDDSGRDLMGSECETLLLCLNRTRDAVVLSLEGMLDEQYHNLSASSGWRAVNLIRHLIGVEEHWFQRVFLDETPGSVFTDVRVGATREPVAAAYRRVCARSDEILRACPDLATTAKIADSGEHHSLRAIVVRVIAETARCAGHAVFLGAQIEGSTPGERGVG
jgi:hypothetical protein